MNRDERAIVERLLADAEAREALVRALARWLVRKEADAARSARRRSLG
jgi:hypothetical protein